ncbi:hypothetical protein EMCRGX_G025952 [Ephydatia muelleri]
MPDFQRFPSFPFHHIFQQNLLDPIRNVCRGEASGFIDREHTSNHWPGEEFEITVLLCLQLDSAQPYTWEMAGFIGPIIPPNLKTNDTTEEQQPVEQKETADGMKEAAPLVEGCQPPHSTSPAPPTNNQTETFGPALPVAMYGPTLPSHLSRNSTSNVRSPSSNSSSEADDEVVGPMPAGDEEREQAERRKRLEIEKHAQAMKDKLSGKDKEESKLERESWMTELPTNKKSFGLGPRKFREAAFEPGDQSVWTDTPADKERKAQQPDKEKKKKTEVETDAVEASRNKEMRRRMEEYNKEHRSESLAEIHRKKRATAVVGTKEERKPFNRDTDLEISRTVDPAKKQSLLRDSASLLASKFTPSKRTFL